MIRILMTLLTLMSISASTLLAQSNDDQIKKARASLLDRNYEDALKRFDLVLSSDPDNIEAQLGKLEAHNGLGHKTEITSFTQKRTKGTTVENHVFNAQVQLMSKNASGAEGELKKALGQDANHYMALYMMGLIKTAKGDKNTAFKYFSKSIKARKSFPENYYYVGDLYFTTGKTEKAVKYWKEYLKLVPPNGKRYDYVNKKLQALGGG